MIIDFVVSLRLRLAYVELPFRCPLCGAFFPSPRPTSCDCRGRYLIREAGGGLAVGARGGSTALQPGWIIDSSVTLCMDERGRGGGQTSERFIPVFCCYYS